MKFIIVVFNPEHKHYVVYGESPRGGFVETAKDETLVSQAVDRVAFWLDTIDPNGPVYLVNLSNMTSFMSATENADAAFSTGA